MFFATPFTCNFIVDINEECRKRDLERLFTKYGPLKEIWLASYAPFYAFIVFRTKRDAEVNNIIFWNETIE